MSRKGFQEGMAGTTNEMSPPVEFGNLGQSVNILMTAAGGLLIAVGFIAFAVWLCGRCSLRRARALGETRVAVSKLGLSKEAIARLPVTSVSGERTGECCAICLGEFSDKLRVLPKCNHCFHTECIDMWLHSHKTCPTCRSDLSGLEQAGEVHLSVANAV